MSTSTPTSPTETIHRVLFLSPSVHVYAIPPLTSAKGHTAATWTHPSIHQFPPCRLRILETATPSSSTTSSSPPPPSTSPASTTITITLLLEDPTTTALFAAAPYTSPATIAPALDSSRFFAVRVVGDGGRKAVLGIGFEERAEAFDFNVAVGEVRKVLGMEMEGARRGEGGEGGKGKGTGKGKAQGQGYGGEGKRDWSLKAGQTIHVDVGRRRGGASASASAVSAGGGGNPTAGAAAGTAAGAGQKGRSFNWIAPPSAGREGEGFGVLPSPPAGATGGGMGFLPPPPSAKDVREENRRAEEAKRAEMRDLGFDDGEFGEFQ